MNAIQWTSDEKVKLADSAKQIYATAVVDGQPCSKLYAFREAVTEVLPVERQREIKTLAHIAYWANQLWPVNTEPTDVIDRIRAERESRAQQRVPLLIRQESPAAPPVVEAQPASAAPLEPADLGSFWKPEPKPEIKPQESLFDEAELASRAQQNASANVHVTHKRSRHIHPDDSPEALVQRGLLGLLNERVEQVVDRRCSAVFNDKTQAFIEAALKSTLSSFHDDMVALVSTLESSVNASIDKLKAYVDEVAARAPMAPVSAPKQDSRQPELAPANRSGPCRQEESQQTPVGTQDEAHKLAILIAGIHPRIVPQIEHRFGSKFHLECWCGPHDRRSLDTLLRQQLDGIIVCDTNGGAEIFQALKTATVPHIKARGTVSGCAVILDRALQLKHFPTV